MTAPLLTVSVKGPNRQEFNGLATSVTSLNKKGKFDILPFHANFITLIKEYLIIRQMDKKKITFPLETGIIKVEGDKVNVVIGV
ncbi:MAG TPA: hypothetical protein VLG67_01250 [Candidatus Saccharimonadales bacterium]|nr:hypothetical protein [Candidatus Saccharimonadales bacterium]